jgi:hypothetical protein
MKINVDRLCKLAGLNNGQKRSTLTEASNRSFHDEAALQDEVPFRYGSNQLNEEMDDMGMEQDMGFFDDEFGEDLQDTLGSDEMYEGPGDEEGPGDLDPGPNEYDEVIEIDERMLVQELRRARNIMNESRNRKIRAKRRRVNEQRMNEMIEEEVRDMLDQYRADSKWVYGNNRPRNSRRGQVATMFPGIGFRNSK